MWGLFTTVFRVIKTASVSSSLVSSLANLSAFSLSNITANVLNPLQILSKSNRLINGFLSNSLTLNVSQTLPFYNTIYRVSELTKAYKSYKDGGIIKVGINYQNLFKSNRKTFNIRAVQNINPTLLQNTNLLKQTYYYKNGKRLTIEDIKGTKKVKTKDEIIKDRLKRIKKKEQAQAIQSSFNALANYGFSHQSVKRIASDKANKYMTFLNEKGSNKRLQTTLDTLNNKLDRLSFTDLEEYRTRLAKGIKIKEFINNLNPKGSPKTVSKYVANFFDEQGFTFRSSFSAFDDYNKNQDVNKMVSTWFTYFRNMNERTLKGIEIWINPDEFYKQHGYNTTNVRSYLKTVEGSYNSRGGSSGISGAVFLPPYPESETGLFLLKVKKSASKSKNNPQMLYSFGELWGTPSIRRSTFLQIFNDPEHMGTLFGRYYFRKYKKKSEGYTKRNKNKRKQKGV